MTFAQEAQCGQTTRNSYPNPISVLFLFRNVFLKTFSPLNLLIHIIEAMELQH
jgi:hypothetical protein